MKANNHTQLIKTEATRLGFFHCGISKADFLEEEAPLLEQWLKDNRHGQMKYMENYFDKRLDPRLLVPGAKSVVSLLLNYFPEEDVRHPELVSGSNLEMLKQVQHDGDGKPKISKYAYGKDYHFVIKEKLKELVAFIRTNIGDVNGRVFVDSAPVMDKAWAKKSGLGWVGKNSNIINKQQGSFFFIAELIIDLDLEYDSPVADHCGTCTRCIDACPTDAIVQPYLVDGSKCISYFTIELKENTPPEMKNKFQDWAFGCDICQDVCPWNRFSKPHNEPHFMPNPEALNLTRKDWEEMTEEVFRKLFKDSPLKRAGFEKMMDNIKAL